MDRNTFFELSVGLRRFLGVMSADGPYILSDEYGHHGVALGNVTSIAELADAHGTREWWIVKYSSERRVRLHGLSSAEITRLGAAFGIPIRSTEGTRRCTFFRSAAFRGLTDWVKAHPRIAKRYRANSSYLPQWYKRANAAAGTTVGAA